MGFKRKGKSISEFVRQSKEAVDPAIEMMMDDGNTFLLKAVQENTPVETEALRRSITKMPVINENGVWRSGVFTEVEYGPHVEHGTGLWGPKRAKYRIEPKDPNGVLAFFVKRGGVVNIRGEQSSTRIAEGQLVFAKYVMHPGSPGQHMFAIGVSAAEASFDEITQRGLNEWVRRSERP